MLTLAPSQTDNILAAALAEASVTVAGYAYRVDFGPGNQPQQHLVNKRRECSCHDPACPAIQAVAKHLQAGGPRAPDPAFDYWPYTPTQCPICGAAAGADAGLDCPEHGHGWSCAKYGRLCYWAARSVVLAAGAPFRQYAIPPRTRAGELLLPPVDPADYQQALEQAKASALGWVRQAAARQNEVGYAGVTRAELLQARQEAFHGPAPCPAD